MAHSSLADSTFGALLSRHRLAAVLTQEALAERAGMSAEGIATLNSPREYTEQQEYERLRAALRALLGDTETTGLLAEGEALDHDRAAALSQSL